MLPLIFTKSKSRIAKANWHKYPKPITPIYEPNPVAMALLFNLLYICESPGNETLKKIGIPIIINNNKLNK